MSTGAKEKKIGKLDIRRVRSSYLFAHSGFEQVLLLLRLLLW